MNAHRQPMSPERKYRLRRTAAVGSLLFATVAALALSGETSTSQKDAPPTASAANEAPIPAIRGQQMMRAMRSFAGSIIGFEPRIDSTCAEPKRICQLEVSVTYNTSDIDGFTESVSRTLAEKPFELHDTSSITSGRRYAASSVTQQAGYRLLWEASVSCSVAAIADGQRSGGDCDVSLQWRSTAVAPAD